MDDCFSRIKELDLAKTFTITVSMVGIHVMYHLADCGTLASSVAADVLNILATAWCAPVFMFCMGVTLGYSRHRNPSDLFKRGVHVLTVGMVLNILRYGPFAYTAHATGNDGLLKELAMIFNFDILQFAGLALMLMALCRHLGMTSWRVLALSVLMNGAGTLLTGHFTSSYAINQLLGCFYHTPTCSCFPLLNWFIFVAAGGVMGKVYKESADADRVFRFIVPVCGTVAVVHQWLSISGSVSFFRPLENDWEYYSMALPDALCIAFGVAPFMLGIFRMVGRLTPDSWMGILGYPSRHINQFFCVSWVWIMWTVCFFPGLDPAATFTAFLGRWAVVLALTTASVAVYNGFLRKFAAPFFGHRETAWTIGVWTALISRQYQDLMQHRIRIPVRPLPHSAVYAGLHSLGTLFFKKLSYSQFTSPV